MTVEEQPIKTVETKDLLANVEDFYNRGYRCVQACCTKTAEDSFEVTYSFDKDLKFENLRIAASKETEIPSITGIYKGAFLYENEMMELFGVNIKGINVDFKGTLYKKKTQHPFSTDASKGGEACQKGQ